MRISDGTVVLEPHEKNELEGLIGEPAPVPATVDSVQAWLDHGIRQAESCGGIFGSITKGFLTDHIVQFRVAANIAKLN